MRRALVVVISLSLASVACKGDRGKCEQAVRNFATLVYWKKADAEIAAAPEAERAALKRKKLSLFQNELESGVDGLVSQCASANNDDQVDCMIAAKTADEALECADLAGD